MTVHIARYSRTLDLLPFRLDLSPHLPALTCHLVLSVCPIIDAAKEAFFDASDIGENPLHRSKDPSLPVGLKVGGLWLSLVTRHNLIHTYLRTLALHAMPTLSSRLELLRPSFYSLVRLTMTIRPIGLVPRPCFSLRTVSVFAFYGRGKTKAGSQYTLELFHTWWLRMLTFATRKIGFPYLPAAGYLCCTSDWFPERLQSCKAHR
jgi:hypothetical protein